MNPQREEEAHARLEWSDALLLGHGPMDELHEEFVELLLEMETADDAALPKLMDKLETHLHEHFGLEDRAMEETAFPPRQCHIDEHRAVMQSVLEVKRRLAVGDVVECRNLLRALTDWFPSHAHHLDSALAHWINKLTYGGKTVILRRNMNLSG